MHVQTKWTGLARHFYSLKYAEVLDLVNLWRFGLGPRPRDLPAHIVTLNDLPKLKGLKGRSDGGAGLWRC